MTTTPTSNTANGDPIQVNLSYDGSNNLVETLTDLTTSATWQQHYSVGSLAATVGGKTAYLGFTGADGAGDFDADDQQFLDRHFRWHECAADHHARDHPQRRDARSDGR